MNIAPKQTIEVAKTRELGQIGELIQIVERKGKCIHTKRTKLISVLIMEEIKSKRVT